MEPYDVIVNQPVVIDNVSASDAASVEYKEKKLVFLILPHESSPLKTKKKFISSILLLYFVGIWNN